MSSLLVFGPLLACSTRSSFGARYGACNNDVDWTPRPSAYVWQLANTLLWGNVTASAASPTSAQVAIFSTYDASATALHTEHGRALLQDALGSAHSLITNAAGLCVLVVINYSGADRVAMFQLAGWPAGSPASDSVVAVFTVSEEGLASSNTTFAALQGVVVAPQDTVQFFVLPVPGNTAWPLPCSGC